MNAPEMIYQDYPVEAIVLGSIMLDNNGIDRVGDLRADHFYSHAHRAIFGAIHSLISVGKMADVLTVHEAILSGGNDVSLKYLNDLVTGCFGISNTAHHSQIIKEYALMREMAKAASNVQAMVIDRVDPPAEILNKAQEEFGRLADQAVQKGPASMQEAMARYVELLDKRFHGEQMSPAVPTGFKDLDESLNGGIRRGALVALGARPGMGKSALGESIAINAATYGASVLFLSMEMPETEVTERAIANWGKISATQLAKASKDLEWNRITYAAQMACQSRLFIDDQPGLHLMDVMTKARGIKRKHGLDLLIVDYLQLMVGTEEKRYLQIEAITKGLKTLAKNLDIAVIALSQFSRDIEKRGSTRPKLSDFRDSGSIEQDSDIVIGLYREEQENPETDWKGMAELFILKNRQGKLGKVCLKYLGDFMRFEDFDGIVPSTDRPRQQKRKGFDG